MTPELALKLALSLIEPYKGWLFMAALAFVAYRHRGDLAGWIAKAKSLIPALPTVTTTTTTVDDAAAIKAFGVLKTYFKGNAEAKKSLKSLWPCFQDDAPGGG